jgi:hypothetical protein
MIKEGGVAIEPAQQSMTMIQYLIAAFFGRV